MLFYPRHRIGLDVQKRVILTFDGEGFLLGTGVDPDYDGLSFACRSIEEFDVEETSVEPADCSAFPNQLSCSCSMAGHQSLACAAYYRNVLQQ